MRCPNCSTYVVSASILKCPRCDWTLKTLPPATSSETSDLSLSADPSGAGPAWEPKVPPRRQFWDMTTRSDEYESLPIVGQAPHGVSPAGGAFEHLPAQSIVPAPDLDVPLPPAMTVPLTSGQKTELLVWGLLPILVPAGFLIFIFFIFRGSSQIDFSSMPILFILLIGGPLLALMYIGVKNLQDFGSGVAVVRIGRLNKPRLGYTGSRRGSTSYHVEFAPLGMFFIDSSYYDTARHNALYRLTYSAASKRIWAIQLEHAQPPPISA